jgi:PIN domain nuclease of toxin-antitoxin system
MPLIGRKSRLREKGFWRFATDYRSREHVHQLPRIGEHRDPFERLVVWQAIRENMVLVLRDRAMSAYQTCGLSLLW